MIDAQLYKTEIKCTPVQKQELKSFWTKISLTDDLLWSRNRCAILTYIWSDHVFPAARWFLSSRKTFSASIHRSRSRI